MIIDPDPGGRHELASADLAGHTDQEAKDPLARPAGS
jgi:hypothetical protein